MKYSRGGIYCGTDGCVIRKRKVQLLLRQILVDGRSANCNRLAFSRGYPGKRPHVRGLNFKVVEAHRQRRRALKVIERTAPEPEQDGRPIRLRRIDPPKLLPGIPIIA